MSSGEKPRATRGAEFEVANGKLPNLELGEERATVKLEGWNLLACTSTNSTLGESQRLYCELLTDNNIPTRGAMGNFGRIDNNAFCKVWEVGDPERLARICFPAGLQISELQASVLNTHQLLSTFFKLSVPTDRKTELPDDGFADGTARRIFEISRHPQTRRVQRFAPRGPKRDGVFDNL